MHLKFAVSDPLTVGAELELQLIDRKSLELSSSSLEILKLLTASESYKAEIYQSMIEVTTGICHNAKDIGQQLRESTAELLKASDRLGVAIASAGTHPFSNYLNGHIFPDARYKKLLMDYKWIAKRLLIFGLHVHIGMRNSEYAIAISNGLLSYLPFLLALSASSPFCNGEDTRLASSRTTYFESLPTGGHPCTFRSWEEFNSTYQSLVKTGSIHSTKDLWWDVRPSPHFGTIEIRICDSPSTIYETEALVALLHALAHKFDHDLQNGLVPEAPPMWNLRENKWRAVRYGIRADFIDNKTGEMVSAQDFFKKLELEIEPFITSLKYEKHMEVIHQILRFGTSSDRQRSAYLQANNSLLLPVHTLIQEFESDQPNWKGRPMKLKKDSGGNQCA